jgi:TetR/AcrR family transcriptional regulator, fatty acid metabolism regulator protein
MKVFSDRQQQIINAAIELIAKGGIQELTIKHLSKKIGISEPALYRHFESKTAILEAIQSEFSDKKQAFFSDALVENTLCIDKILKVIKNIFATFAQKPALAAVIFSEEFFQNEQQLAVNVSKIMEQSRLHFLEIVSSGQANRHIRADIPAEHVVIIIMGSLRLIVKNWYLSKYSFDLEIEGVQFGDTLRKILKSI